MAIKIRPIVVKDAASYRRCYDAVLKERLHFAEEEAPPLSVLRKNLRMSVRKKSPFLVAVDGERVVGWAAVLSSNFASLKHVGILGAGVLAGYRGNGLGRKLTERVLKLCGRRFDSVVLYALGKNKRAQKLGKKLGFKRCAWVKNGAKMPYGYDDRVAMQKMMRGQHEDIY
ncbi:MAG: N-acetyltransferase family protein [Rhodospirillaceae bacterium]